MSLFFGGEGNPFFHGLFSESGWGEGLASEGGDWRCSFATSFFVF